MLNKPQMLCFITARQQIDLMVQKINIKQEPYVVSCAWMFMSPEQRIQ